VRQKDRGGLVTPAFAFYGTGFVQRLESVAWGWREEPKAKFEVTDGKPSEEHIKENSIIGEWNPSTRTVYRHTGTGIDDQSKLGIVLYQLS